MTTNFHTPIVFGSAASSASVNTIAGTLDAELVSLNTQIDVAHNADGTHKTNSIETADIQDDAVTAAKIADDAVGAAQIVAGAVGSAELAAGAVIAGKYGAGSIATADVADDAITAAKIAAATITAAEIATDTIIGGNIAPGAITSSELGAASVGTTAIINAAVTADKIAAAVAGDGLTGGAGSALAVSVGSGPLEIVGDVVGIKAASVTSAMITNNTIVNSDLALDISVGSLLNLVGHVGTTTSTTSAILELAQRHHNMVFDSFWQHIGPTRRVNGRAMFYNPQYLEDWTTSAANHPRGSGGSVTYNGGAGGAGIIIIGNGQGFKSGQRFEFDADVLGDNGITVRLAFRGRDATGTFVGTQRSGTGVAQDGVTPTTLSVGNTLDADCYEIAVYLGYTAGSGDTIWYSKWGGAGYAALTPDIGDDALWLREEARYPQTEEAFGRASLRDWRGALAKSQQGTAAAVVAVIGDSWVQNDLITAPLRSLLTTAYGNAGTGWISAVAYSGGAGASPPTGFTLTKAGTWSERDAFSDSMGVDIQHANSVDDSAPVGSMQLIGTMTDVYIHYLKQANGGSFRWRIDGGAWTTVATANAGNLFATEAITGLSNASHTLDVEVVTASVAGVTLMGFDTRIGTDGVRLHKLGNGGADGGDYTDVDATIWQAGLTALAPNLVVLVLGTNDDSGDRVPSTFDANITTLITRIRAAMPLCSIVLVTPGRNGLAAGTYSTDYYVQVLRSRAVADGLACYDLYLAVGNYDEYGDADAMPLWANDSHYNLNGGQAAADGLFERLLRVR